eukprot:2804664-Pyramimonas_sp.AAC.1
MARAVSVGVFTDHLPRCKQQGKLIISEKVEQHAPPRVQTAQPTPRAPRRASSSNTSAAKQLSSVQQ